MNSRRSIANVLLLVALAACSKQEERAVTPRAGEAPVSILLVTLDTTRYDAIGPDATSVETPAFNALVTRGLRFTRAYAATPQTLPAHTSMFTGVYPPAHGIHENGRYLGASVPLIAEKLKTAGYRTEAYVSAFALAKRFGLGRGFDVYDDASAPGSAERSAKETTEAVLASLARPVEGPLFLWVHYYDPHDPYVPPEPYRSRYAASPYHGEVAAMDEQLGRLVADFERRIAGPKAIIVLGDHGEGLGDHGENGHGNLLYESTMRVPMVLVAPGVQPGRFDEPVSSRRVFHTISDLAGLGAELSLRRPTGEAVAGEAMKPYLDFGWQPQVMAIEGRMKAIFAGKAELYDVVSDPAERKDLAGSGDFPRAIRSTLRDYPLPSAKPQAPSAMNEEERKKLASLGYVTSDVKPAVRPDAPRPIDMAHLFAKLDRASVLFVREAYAEAIPLLNEILDADPKNLEALLRLAAAYSSLGRNGEALDTLRKAESVAPGSQDVQTYLALHYLKGRDWQKAVSLLESVLSESPDRLPAMEGLAAAREREGRLDEAVALRERIYAMREPAARELAELGAMQMTLGRTIPAIASFERSRALDPASFSSDLELGVLYLAARRFEDARTALDRVPANHPARAMALFKRAQVSVLLNEADAGRRVALARQFADADTRELIAREKLFEGR